jgi:hypothetical protein
MALNVLKSNIDNFPQEKVIRYIDRAVEQITKMESLLKSLKSFIIIVSCKRHYDRRSSPNLIVVVFGKIRIENAKKG